ncbi:MAG: hypothetical protein Q8Q39_01035 [bacterium]|nr:hypothetical protein [bacterium]
MYRHFQKNKYISEPKLRVTSYGAPAQGFALVEVLVGLGMASILMIGFAVLILQAGKVSRANAMELKATLYLREVVEVLKDMEQTNWIGVAIAPCLSPFTCHPEPAGGVWSLTTGDETLDGTYTRSFSLDPVYRDATTNDIVTAPGLLDPDTLKASAQITWNNRFTDRTMTVETYLYNLP